MPCLKQAEDLTSVPPLCKGGVQGLRLIPRQQRQDLQFLLRVSTLLLELQGSLFTPSSQDGQEASRRAGMCAARKAIANGASGARPLLPREQKPGMKSGPARQGQDS